MEYKDYYAALGVPRDASPADIKKQFRKLARQFHPDVTKGDTTAERRFKEVSEANEVLSDPEKRRKYDAMGADWQAYERAAAAGARGGAAGAAGAGPFGGFRASPGGGGARYEFRTNAQDLNGFSDFFRAFFGGADADPRSGNGAGAGTRARTGTEEVDLDELLRGMDMDDVSRYAQGGRERVRRASRPAPPRLEAEAEITLEEAYRGTTRIVQIDERRLEVTIPAGVRDGQRIRLSGKAGTGPGAGDLYVNVRIADHGVFSRTGDDLQREVPLTLEEAMLGAEIPVETLKGRVLLRVPPGTQSGRTFRLGGQGMPHFRGEGHGDLFVKTRVVLPTGLDDTAQKLFRAFADHVRQPDPRDPTRRGAATGAARDSTPGGTDRR